MAVVQDYSSREGCPIMVINDFYKTFTPEGIKPGLTGPTPMVLRKKRSERGRGGEEGWIWVLAEP